MTPDEPPKDPEHEAVVGEVAGGEESAGAAGGDAGVDGVEGVAAADSTADGRAEGASADGPPTEVSVSSGEAALALPAAGGRSGGRRRPWRTVAIGLGAAVGVAGIAVLSVFIYSIFDGQRRLVHLRIVDDDSGTHRAASTRIADSTVTTRVVVVVPAPSKAPATTRAPAAPGTRVVPATAPATPTAPVATRPTATGTPPRSPNQRVVSRSRTSVARCCCCVTVHPPAARVSRGGGRTTGSHPDRTPSTAGPVPGAPDRDRGGVGPAGGRPRTARPTRGSSSAGSPARISSGLRRWIAGRFRRGGRRPEAAAHPGSSASHRPRRTRSTA